MDRNVIDECYLAFNSDFLTASQNKQIANTRHRIESPYARSIVVYSTRYFQRNV